MARIKSLVFILSVGFLIIGCASKKVSLDEPTPMDKQLNAGTGDKGDKVGVRGDSIVVQKRVYLEEELAKKHDSITDLENTIYGESIKYPGGLWLGLQACRKRISDPRLGGSGAPEPMETWEKLSEAEPDFDYRVDKKDNVVAVSEEDLGAKIANLTKMQNILERRYGDFKQKLDSCENAYHVALLKTGLNPEDTQASGEWVEGPNGYKVWKMRRPSTQDPEELMRRKALRDQSGVSDKDQ
jgi:hypothetical protein